MRFSTYFLTGLATVVSLTTASATVQKRSFTDKCARINESLVIAGVDYGHINSCVCLGTLANFIATNPVTILAVAGSSTPAVTAALTAYINADSPGECTFPDNSVPECTGNCGYKCKDGFVKRDDHCVLSPSSRSIKREEDADQKCDFGFTKCGVYDQTASRTGFECINTKTSLESCGGCTIAFGPEPATGIDCTAIPGVTGVGCEKGVCVVSECRAGWLLVDSSGCAQS